MKEVCSVWIIDDDNSIRWVLEKAFSKSGMETSSFDNAEDALSRLRRDVPIGFVAPELPGATSLSLRKEVIQPQVPLRLPCYDLVPVTSLAVGTTELWRLRALPASMT